MDLDPITPKIERFLAKHGMAPSAFGRAALDDPTLVQDLFMGRELKIKTRAKVEEFMKSYKNGSK